MMQTWVWFIVTPIWVVSLGLLLSSGRLWFKASAEKKANGFNSAFPIYDQMINRNLTASGLNILTVFIMILSR